MIAPTTKQAVIEQRLDEFEIAFKEKEPRIHAFIAETGRFARLRKQADALKQNPLPLSPLFGKLFAAKDIFRVDGLPTKAGSRIPAAEFRGKEASSVTKLRQAGMLVAGKTVTTEFAYFAPGPTRNPHSPEHTPGGSSSGSAAAVAAGLVDLALGTQTIGSIIRPASFCGVIGFKPSYARISADGVIPLAPSLDHVGLFAKNVATIKEAAKLLCNDWSASEENATKPTLAIPAGEYHAKASGQMRRHFNGVIKLLEKTGYWVKLLDPFPDFTEIAERHHVILAAEASQVHASWYEAYGPLYHHRMASLIEEGFAIPQSRLEDAQRGSRELRLDLSSLMDMHGIDVWLSPSAVGPAPLGLASTGDPVMNLPWTQAGLPTLNLPAGIDSNGLPLGLQLSADFGRDEDLLAWAIGIERALGDIK